MDWMPKEKLVKFGNIFIFDWILIKSSTQTHQLQLFHQIISNNGLNFE